MENEKKEDQKVEGKQEEVKVETKKTDEELRKEAEEKELAKQRKAEIYLKIADGLEKGAEKVDGLVDQRKKLGEYSAPIALGLVIFLVMAVVKYPELLVYLVVGLGIGLLSKIIKKIYKK